jgi:hypothetical protein
MKSLFPSILIVIIAGSTVLAAESPATTGPANRQHRAESQYPVIDLSAMRREVMDYCKRMQIKDAPYGHYRGGAKGRAGLYASCDIALIRVCMGEDLTKTLTDKQRQEWIDHINSFQQPDGSYSDTFGHTQLHANGMAIGALGVLGGKQKYAVQLYEPLDEPDEIVQWLETEVDWVNQHGGSHAFWGGMHCFSMSKRCTDEWLDAVFTWLNENLDEKTGWWRKGVPHSNVLQPLGGSVHIIPIYEHHGREFPYPERVIDSVLKLQQPGGEWHTSPRTNYLTYIDMDALYALLLMSQYAPDYRKQDIQDAINKYGTLAYSHYQVGKEILLNGHPHGVLAAVSAFGCLQQLNPDRFQDTATWTDIFSHRGFYLTDEVEVLPEK